MLALKPIRSAYLIQKYIYLSHLTTGVQKVSQWRQAGTILLEPAPYKLNSNDATDTYHKGSRNVSGEQVDRHPLGQQDSCGQLCKSTKQEERGSHLTAQVPFPQVWSQENILSMKPESEGKTRKVQKFHFTLLSLEPKHSLNWESVKKWLGGLEEASQH